MRDHLYFRGTSKYCNLKQLNQFGKYTVTMYLHPDDIAKYVKSGIQAKMLKDEAGTFVNFSRTPSVVNMKTKEIRELGPPKLFDKSGQPTDWFVNPGEEITCKVTVYDTKKGKGCSLEAVILTQKEGRYGGGSREDQDYDGVRV